MSLKIYCGSRCGRGGEVARAAREQPAQDGPGLGRYGNDFVVPGA